MALLTLHVEHDGWPEKVAKLGRDATFGDLGKLIARCLRRDPRKRPNAGQARAELAGLAKRYKGLSWPLQIGAPAAQRTA
jgi:hypothetical protein